MRRCLTLTLIGAFLLATHAYAQEADNPPMEGFNMADSDGRAIEIADQVMQSMGGRANWDQTRYLSWGFGGDGQVWDKWTGRFRWQRDNLVVLMNIRTQEGSAYIDGQAAPEAEELLQAGYRNWVNSSYWLLMPYKLKDSGVTLGYMGEGVMEDGRAAEILSLTFENVGLTPQNRYDVYVDTATMLVGQWSYYADADDAEPRFTLPWLNWTQHGDIMLSDSRGARGDGEPFLLPDVGVYSSLPDAVWEDPHRVELSTLGSMTP